MIDVNPNRLFANIKITSREVDYQGVTWFLLSFERTRDKKQLVSKRRYTNFQTFWELICLTKPECVVPTIPPKDYTIGRKFFDNSFQDQSLLDRQAQLERFLNQVVNHIKLFDSCALEYFLTDECFSDRGFRDKYLQPVIVENNLEEIFKGTDEDKQESKADESVTKRVGQWLYTKTNQAIAYTKERLQDEKVTRSDRYGNFYTAAEAKFDLVKDVSSKLDQCFTQLEKLWRLAEKQ